jgi:hypothetical protein
MEAQGFIGHTESLGPAIAPVSPLCLYSSSLDGPARVAGSLHSLFEKGLAVLPHVFTGDYLFSSPTEAPTTAFVVVPIIFGAIFLLSALFWWRRAKIAPDNPVLRRFIRRVAKAGMWTAGIGLFLAAMRYLQVDYIDAPIFLDLLVLVMIGIVGYFIYEMSERYPVQVWHLQQSHVERRYRPEVKRKAAPQVQRANTPRGKRRR